MKKSLTRVLHFVRTHKYGKPALGLTILALIGSVSGLAYWAQHAPPVALSQVAAAIASGQVVSVEDALDSGALKLSYADGSIQESRRDTSAPFLQQMSLLGVSQAQLSALEYQVQSASPLATTGGATALVLALALVGVLIAVARTRSGPITARRAYVEGEVPGTTFNDVAGLDEMREELADIVTFLKDKSDYERLGAHMPRGVLLVGDPGTGKTLLARALAGESGVPFFSTSGSEFVEMYVGVGAGRVRSLFKQARAKAPCIVFIDEIDAVGRRRHSSGGGGEMEQDQTLNQLLVEMDGFKGSEGVVVLAATNRTDVLDPALTRPGRFDRHVNVPKPDVKGRRAILDVHAKSYKLAAEVDLDAVAKATPSLAGADLANIVNEAAILAARDRQESIRPQDFEEAVEKTLTGSVRSRSRVITEEERRTIAYHEAGHAVVMHATPHSDPVHKITIVARGQMGGFTMALPEQETTLVSRNRFSARITGLMGGRVAEELFCDDITSGAGNDLKVATQLAEEMVMRLGMSATGLRVFGQAEAYGPAGGARSGQKTYEALDHAIGEILDRSYDEARRILTERREAVERVSLRLLEQETLSREEFEALVC